MRPLILLLPTTYLHLGCRDLLCVLLAAALSACGSVKAHRIEGNTYEVQAVIADADYQAEGLLPLERLATYKSAQITHDAGADYFRALGRHHCGWAQMGLVAGVAYLAGPGSYVLWQRIEVVKADELPEDATGYIDAGQVLERWPDIDDFVVDTSALPVLRPHSGITE